MTKFVCTYDENSRHSTDADVGGFGKEDDAELPPNPVTDPIAAD